MYPINLVAGLSSITSLSSTSVILIFTVSSDTPDSVSKDQPVDSVLGLQAVNVAIINTAKTNAIIPLTFLI